MELCRFVDTCINSNPYAPDFLPLRNYFEFLSPFGSMRVSSPSVTPNPGLKAKACRYFFDYIEFY